MNISLTVERLSLEDVISKFVSEPNRSAMLQFLETNDAVLKAAHGSTNNHQAWPGGWWDHTTDGLNYAPALYEFLSAIRPLPFPLEDAIVAFFGHDLEKPFAYEQVNGERVRKAAFREKAYSNQFRTKLFTDAGVTLTPLQQNGITYAEGELGDYTNTRRVMSELAAFVHMLDTLSARLYHDYPKSLGEDEWPGAYRIQTT